MNKRFILVVILLFCFVGAKCYGNESVSVEINKQLIIFEASDGVPFVDTNNRSQIPVRKVLETIGISVDWDPINEHVVTRMGNDECLIPIGENRIIFNGQDILIDTVAVIKDSRTYIPIRPIIEAYGYHIAWDSYKNCIYIYTDDLTQYYEELLVNSQKLQDFEKNEYIYQQKNSNMSATEFSENDKYVFFSYSDTYTGYQLVQMDKVTRKCTTLYKYDAPILSVQVYDHCIYFLQYQEYLNAQGGLTYYTKLLSYDLNTKKVKTLIDYDKVASSFIDVDGWIYYANSKDDYKLYRMKSDISSDQKVSDIGSAYYINKWGNTIVHGSGSSICITTEENGIFKSQNYEVNRYNLGFTLNGDNMYFNDWPYNVYISNTNDPITRDKFIKTNAGDSFVIKGDYMYICLKNDIAIARVNLDGTGETIFPLKAKLDGIRDLSIIDDYLYFGGFTESPADPSRVGKNYVYRMKIDGTGEALIK